jgi:hypothetical protein
MELDCGSEVGRSRARRLRIVPRRSRTATVERTADQKLKALLRYQPADCRCVLRRDPRDGRRVRISHPVGSRDNRGQWKEDQRRAERPAGARGCRSISWMMRMSTPSASSRHAPSWGRSCHRSYGAPHDTAASNFARPSRNKRAKLSRSSRDHTGSKRARSGMIAGRLQPQKSLS